jgi:hypothetical protein
MDEQIDADVDADVDERLAVDRVLLLDEADPEPQLPVWEPTGEPSVDAALDLLDQLDPDDVHAHAAVFDEVHRRLRATLTDLDAPN